MHACSGSLLTAHMWILLSTWRNGECKPHLFQMEWRRMFSRIHEHHNPYRVNRFPYKINRNVIVVMVFFTETVTIFMRAQFLRSRESEKGCTINTIHTQSDWTKQKNACYIGHCDGHFDKRRFGLLFYLIRLFWCMEQLKLVWQTKARTIRYLCDN